MRLAVGVAVDGPARLLEAAGELAIDVLGGTGDGERPDGLVGVEVGVPGRAEDWQAAGESVAFEDEGAEVREGQDAAVRL
mgnify:CR=1 FL=1